jgi:hypothetical protein
MADKSSTGTISFFLRLCHTAVFGADMGQRGGKNVQPRASEEAAFFAPEKNVSLPLFPKSFCTSLDDVAELRE